MNTILKHMFWCLLISMVCLGYDSLAAQAPSVNAPVFSPAARQILVFPFKEQKTYIINANGSESDSRGFVLDQQQIRQKEQLRADKLREKMGKSAQKANNADPNKINTAGQVSPQTVVQNRRAENLKPAAVKFTGGQVMDKDQTKYKVILESENDSVGFILADSMFSSPPQKGFGTTAAIMYNVSGDYAEDMKYLCVKWTEGESLYYYCVDIKAVIGKEGLLLELQTWSDTRSLGVKMRDIVPAEEQQKIQMTPQEIVDHRQLTSFQREGTKDWNLDRVRRKAQKENEMYRRIVEKGELPQERNLPYAKKAGR